MKRLFLSVSLAMAGVFFVPGAMAQNTSGPVRLGPDSFGKAGFGTPQSLGSDILEEARQLGLFEDTANIRSGWIDTAARITGRLDIRTAGFDQDGNPINLACTGTAISDRLILTNAHCVPQAGRKRALALRFLPNYRDARRLNDVIAYPVRLKPLEIGDPQRLDYAILQLRVPLAGYRPMAFSIRDPGPGEPLVMMGHPEGQPLLLSRGRCRSDREVPLSGADVIHQCATRQGSSGSLVWSSDGHVVGLHYKGGTTLAGRTVNRAVRIAALLPESPTLRQLLPGAIDEPQVKPGPGCAQMAVPGGFSCVIGLDGTPQIVPQVQRPAKSMTTEIELKGPGQYFAPRKVIAGASGGLLAVGSQINGNQHYSVIAGFDHAGQLGPTIARSRQDAGAFFRIFDAATNLQNNQSVVVGNTFVGGWGEVGAPKVSMRGPQEEWVDLPIPSGLTRGRATSVAADQLGGFHVVFASVDRLGSSRTQAHYAYYLEGRVVHFQSLPEDIVFIGKIMADLNSGFVLLGSTWVAGTMLPIVARFDARGREVWRIRGTRDAESFQAGVFVEDGSLVVGSAEGGENDQSTVLRTRKISARGDVIWERQTSTSGRVILLGAVRTPTGARGFVGHWEAEYYGPSEGVLFDMDANGHLGQGQKTQTGGKTRLFNVLDLLGGQFAIAQQRDRKLLVTPFDPALFSAR